MLFGGKNWGVMEASIWPFLSYLVKEYVPAFLSAKFGGFRISSYLLHRRAKTRKEQTATVTATLGSGGRFTCEEQAVGSE